MDWATNTTNTTSATTNTGTISSLSPSMATISSSVIGSVNTGGIYTPSYGDIQAKDVVLNGVSLSSTLAKIQERLEILVPDPEMEAKWNRLAELGRQYRELEATLKERDKVLDILTK